MPLKIAAIGNCQVSSFVRCLRRLAPDAEVLGVALEPVRRNGAIEEMAKAAAQCDIVFSQPLAREAYGPLQTAQLEPLSKRYVRYPGIVFTGFHPDCTSLSVEGKHVLSPTGVYHSEILMATYLRGMVVADAIALFNAETYAQLGYFDEFPESRRTMLARCAAQGYDLTEAFEQWLQDGAFMYSVIHPKVRVLASLCQIALRKAGVEPADVSTDDVEDLLARASRWPVYPEIGERLGVHEPFLFASSQRNDDPDLTLKTFAERSFALYRDLPRDALEAAVQPSTRRTLARRA